MSSNAPWALTASTAASWTGSGNNSEPFSDIKGKSDVVPTAAQLAAVLPYRVIAAP